MSARRRRGLVLLVLGVVGVLVTFLSVLSYTQQVASALGPTQVVVVTARDVSSWAALGEQDLSTVSIPTRFVPPGALGAPDDALGLMSPVEVPAGAFVLASGLVEPPSLEPGEREVTWAADGEVSFAGTISTGDVVDVTMAYDRGQVTETTTLSAARVLGVRTSEDADGRPTTYVSLAVPEGDVAELARAQASAGHILFSRHSPSEAQS